MQIPPLPLEIQKSIVKRLYKRYRKNLNYTGPKQGSAVFLKEEAYTVCIIEIGKRMFSGVAKRNPEDRDVQVAGSVLAFRRAVIEADRALGLFRRRPRT